MVTPPSFPFRGARADLIQYNSSHVEYADERRHTQGFNDMVRRTAPAATRKPQVQVIERVAEAQTPRVRRRPSQPPAGKNR